MKQNIKYIIIGIVIAVLLFLPFYVGGTFHTIERSTTTKTDTIFIDKPYKVVTIKKEVIEKPVKVYVYKTDTVFRKNMENDTLISSIQIGKKKAQIHTLTPDGIPTINEYLLPPFKSLTMDYKGNLQINPIKHPKRKKTLHTIGAITLFVGGVFLGAQLDK
ncbi:hypothetical protein ACSTS3_07980 [Aquimarina muelleri]|uniref:hypothetical protein n=1 Tax=Aquimarina muelleri TaxID=279356 RepID=UPI003F685A2E